MKARRQRAFLQPPRPTTRGLSFSDSRQRAVEAVSGEFGQADSHAVAWPRNLLLSRLASGDLRRGMGRTFRPMLTWDDGPDDVWRRPDQLGRPQQLSRPAVPSLLRRAVALAQGTGAIRLLQNNTVQRSVARLDRRTRVCVARRIRKSVLFAAGVAGRRRHYGAGGSSRRTLDSQFSC